MKPSIGMEHVIRQAVPDDRAAVVELVAQAYGPWVPIIGGRPAPLDADYCALIEAARVHLAVDTATGFSTD
jgi:hypothetical protein